MTYWTTSAVMPCLVRDMIAGPPGTRWRNAAPKRTSSQIVYRDGSDSNSLVLIHEPGDEMSLRFMSGGLMFARIVTTDELVGDLLDRPDRSAEDILAAFVDPVLEAFSLRAFSDGKDAAFTEGVERIERIAAAAMAGSSPGSLRFLHLPSPWNGARLALMNQTPDTDLEPQWIEAITRAGEALPRTINFDVKPDGGQGEIRFDVTLKRPSILVRECDALEAMRVAKDLA